MTRRDGRRVFELGPDADPADTDVIFAISVPIIIFQVVPSRVIFFPLSRRLGIDTLVERKLFDDKIEG